MKVLITIVLALLTVVSFALTKEEKAQKKADEDYAKENCLLKNKFLRGDKLRECIKVEINSRKKKQTK